MRRLRIDRGLLDRMVACKDERRLFAKLYPDGIVVSDNPLSNFPLVAEALRAGLSVDWLVGQLEALADVSGRDRLSWLGCGCDPCRSAAASRSDAAPPLPIEDKEFTIAAYLAAAVGALERSP